MGFCCGPSDVQVLPKNASSSSSSSVNSSGDGSNKKKKQPEQGKHQAPKKGEVKEKKRSNLDRAALTTPHFPFHSRPGLM
ncbi:hypothetical protein ACQ4PT_020785 [Festuca glaucescens]